MVTAYSERSKLTIPKGLGLRELGVDYGAYMMSGLDRIASLVLLLQEFLILATKKPVNIPLGHLVDLAVRVYSVGTDARVIP
jgi:hypothetical protein